MTIKRIFHHWEKWECFKAGFYTTTPPNDYTPDSAREAYRDFLADIPRFENALIRVLSEWPMSCEQFLSNSHINRIAWLGQASMCIETGTPSVFRGGFKLLSVQQQKEADNAAERALRNWEKSHAAQNSTVHRTLD